MCNIVQKHEPVRELTMNLYFAPLACSLAARIALYEAGADAQYTYVDLKTKRLADGSDFFDITPMGQVVVLRTDDGVLLTENAAVLQYVADRFPVLTLLGVPHQAYRPPD
jgi:glutathione S-transferase